MVVEGGNATFLYEPDSGYIVQRVLVDGIEVLTGGDTYIFDDVQANHTIYVEFAQPPPPAPPAPTPPSSTVGGMTGTGDPLLASGTAVAAVLLVAGILMIFITRRFFEADRLIYE